MSHMSGHMYMTALRSPKPGDQKKADAVVEAKTPDGYKLVGAMHTDRVEATEEEIDDRIPLSVARWHQHINFCKAPGSQKAAYFGPDAQVRFTRFDNHQGRV